MTSIQIELPQKDATSTKNMQMSFLWSLANNAQDLDERKTWELDKIVQAEQLLSNSKSGGVVKIWDAYNCITYFVTLSALQCDCGKGLCCPFVKQN